MRTEEKGVVYIRISEALETMEKCFLCQLEERLEQRYVSTYLGELVMDPKSREKIVESRGFCNYHSYRMLASASNPASEDGHGLALVLKSVTEQLLNDVTCQKKRKSPALRLWSLHLKSSTRLINGKELLKPVSNEAECPACDHISEMTRIYVEEFVREVGQDKHVQELYDKSEGMCIPHYVMSLYIASSKLEENAVPVVERLVEKQIRVLEKLQTILSSYIEKQDYRFAGKEQVNAEKTVGQSLTRIVGKRGIDRTLVRWMNGKGRTLHETGLG
jgi:hypothetical protein